MSVITNDLNSIVPNGWNVLPLRWYLSCKSGESISSEIIERESTTQKLIPVIGGNGIMGYTDKANVTYETISIGRVGALCGNVHYIDYPTWITDNSLFIFRYDSKSISLKFLKYVLDLLNLNQYSTSTAQPLITSETIKKRKVAFPNIVTQKKIVEFIEKKNREIDLLIDSKEKLIKLLEQQRQAIITETVTKGLNPNVKMKDSGIEWIGEIPEHWVVKPLYSLYKENKLKNKGNEIKNVLSLSYGKIKRRDVESNYGLLPDSFETYQILQKGDIVLRLTDLQNDKKSLRVGLVNEEGIITSAYLGLKQSEKLVSEYTYYLLHSYDLMKVFYGLGSGVRQSMSYTEIKKLPILLPPLEEQQEIVEFLRVKVHENETLVEMLKKVIEKLKEYRQSLIYEAVTGKIDVSDMEVD